MLVGEWNCTCGIFNQPMFYLGIHVSTYSCPKHSDNTFSFMQSPRCRHLVLQWCRKKLQKEERNIWCYHGRDFEPVWPSSVEEFPCHRSNDVQTLFSFCMIQINPITQSTMRFCRQFTGIPPNPKPSTAASCRDEAQTTHVRQTWRYPLSCIECTWIKPHKHPHNSFQLDAITTLPSSCSSLLHLQEKVVVDALWREYEPISLTLYQGFPV